jgi:DNA modification methylase
MMNTNLLEDDVVGKIYLADNFDVLRTLPSESVDLIYIDPPFNTGEVQERIQLKTVRSESCDRVGFQGHRYYSIVVGKKSFADLFDDYMAFLEPRLVEAHRNLAPHGCLYVHLDYR